MYIELDLLCNIVDQDLYSLKTKNLIKNILPKDLFLSSDLNVDNKLLFLNENLPLIKWNRIDKELKISVILLCKYRKNLASFYYDMISRHLIPNNRLDISLFFSTNFKMQKIEETFCVIEAQVALTDEKELNVAYNNISSLAIEIRLGAISDYHAKRIIEFKGLSSDRKTLMVQEKIGSLIQNKPTDFAKGIFSQMQHFLIKCPEEFKKRRDYNHISTVISSLHNVRKQILEKIESFSNKRHFILKFIKTKLKDNNKDIPVLGIIVGLNFLKKREFFEKKHLLRAIKNHIPNLSLVESSHFLQRDEKNSVQVLYLEIEKDTQEDFSYEEIQHLRVALPYNLKSHIEHLIYPVFMPRNEEEIARNIMTLSHQLKYVQDLPQVIINFDKQIENDLSFTIILLRLLKQNDLSIASLINEKKINIKFVPERVKKIGYIRKKYIKEANVFRIILPSSKFFRDDNTIDINEARSKVLDFLNILFGEVRDYNGGMIAKQNEVYFSLKQSLGIIAKQHGILLEKFFYSISPAEMTVLMKKEIIESLFLILLDTIKKWQKSVKKNLFIFKNDDKSLFIITPIVSDNCREKIKKAIENLHLSSSEIASFNISYHETNFLGFAFLTHDESRKQNFIKIIEQVLC